MVSNAPWFSKAQAKSWLLEFVLEYLTYDNVTDFFNAKTEYQFLADEEAMTDYLKSIVQEWQHNI